MLRKREDLTGEKFGKLTVIHTSGKRHGTNVLWTCLCDCGTPKNIRGTDLKSGHTKSCGCLNKDSLRNNQRNLKHGGNGTRLYRIWVYMRKRCHNPKDSNYKYYGAKGINVCDEWRDNFVAFRFWAILNGYQENLTIDRINNNGNYEASNCQWITKSENSIKSHQERVFV